MDETLKGTDVQLNTGALSPEMEEIREGVTALLEKSKKEAGGLLEESVGLNARNLEDAATGRKNAPPKAGVVATSAVFAGFMTLATACGGEGSKAVDSTLQENISRPIVTTPAPEKDGPDLKRDQVETTGKKAETQGNVGGSPKDNQEEGIWLPDSEVSYSRKDGFGYEHKYSIKTVLSESDEKKRLTSSSKSVIFIDNPDFWDGKTRLNIAELIPELRGKDIDIPYGLSGAKLNGFLEIKGNEIYSRAGDHLSKLSPREKTLLIQRSILFSYNGRGIYLNYISTGTTEIDFDTSQGEFSEDDIRVGLLFDEAEETRPAQEASKIVSTAQRPTSTEEPVEKSRTPTPSDKKAESTVPSPTATTVPSKEKPTQQAGGGRVEVGPEAIPLGENLRSYDSVLAYSFKDGKIELSAVDFDHLFTGKLPKLWFEDGYSGELVIDLNSIPGGSIGFSEFRDVEDLVVKIPEDPDEIGNLNTKINFEEKIDEIISKVPLRDLENLIDSYGSSAQVSMDGALSGLARDLSNRGAGDESELKEMFGQILTDKVAGMAVSLVPDEYVPANYQSEVSKLKQSLPDMVREEGIDRAIAVVQNRVLAVANAEAKRKYGVSLPQKYIDQINDGFAREKEAMFLQSMPSFKPPEKGKIPDFMADSTVTIRDGEMVINVNEDNRQFQFLIDTPDDQPAQDLRGYFRNSSGKEIPFSISLKRN